MTDKDYPLVYSTDPNRSANCPKCGKRPNKCRCPQPALVFSGEKTAVLRIEKSGRSGKTVTVIDRLPRHETLVRSLSRELKSRCGSGGTWKMLPEGGVIEIQGDKRDQIRKILQTQGFKVKG